MKKMVEAEKYASYKLQFELVPEGCWYANLRSALSPAQWDKIRKAAYARAGGKCSICGRETRRLEAHERWTYDEKKALQTLQDVVALCSDCHGVVHISRTQLMGRGDEAMEHFMQVNGCSQMDYHDALRIANEEHFRRNKIDEWSVDLSWLNGNL